MAPPTAPGSQSSSIPAAVDQSPAPSPRTGDRISGAKPDESDLSLGLRFPDGFTWGAATSAYQVEGATTEDGRGESVWDAFCREQGRVRGGHTGDIAADHYHRYPADLDLMKSLGLHSYRFSIAWPRVMPDGVGPVNRRGIDFYRRLVDGLHARGIQPMATLFHWDLPQSMQDKGGWESRDAAFRFADYATNVFAALGDDVPTWLTINEPKTVVQNGYLMGIHAPGLTVSDAAYAVAHHLPLAHGLAVQALRVGGVKGRIGPALNLHPVYPADDSAGARRAATLHDGYENRLYLDPIFRGRYPADVLADLGPNSRLAEVILDGDLSIISAPVDLLAIQYYCPYYIDAAGQSVNRWPTSQAFWQQIYPEGMYDVLTRVTRDYGRVPISITENGLPSADQLGPDDTVDDEARVSFLREHFAAAHRAIKDGVPLESYHVWSLLDNFEWQQGYDERWGLVYVDYATQRRVPKRSARWYQQVIARNGP